MHICALIYSGIHTKKLRGRGMELTTMGQATMGQATTERTTAGVPAPSAAATVRVRRGRRDMALTLLGASGVDDNGAGDNGPGDADTAGG